MSAARPPNTAVTLPVGHTSRMAPGNMLTAVRLCSRRAAGQSAARSSLGSCRRSATAPLRRRRNVAFQRGQAVAPIMMAGWFQGRWLKPGEGVRLRIIVPRKLSMGEHIKLVGNHQLLGSWDMEAAPSMRWMNDNEWVYEAVSPVGVHIEFKCLLANDNGSILWEEGDNHVLHVPHEADKPPEGIVRRLQMRCEWGQGSQEGHDTIQMSDEESHAPEFLAMRTHVTEELMLAIEGTLGGSAVFNSNPDFNADGAEVIQRPGNLGILGAYYCRVADEEQLDLASLDVVDNL